MKPHVTATLFSLLVPLLLSRSMAASAPSGHCAWRTCHTVTVEYLPQSTSATTHAATKAAIGVDDGAGSGGGGSGAGGRSIVLHRCLPSNNFRDKCFLSEFTSDSDGLRNFTMRKAQLAEAPLADLCQFRRLSGLDLAENAIASFIYPGQLPPGCLSRLRWLSLRANALREADLSQFLRLSGLEKLDLSENSQLESLYLSSQPQHDASLKVVLASKCRIKQVDISMVRLPSLQDVDLSYNQVSRVTNRLDWHWTLRDVRDIEAERYRRRARDPHYYARLSVQMVQNQIGPEAFDRRTLWGLPVPDLITESDEVVNQLKHYRDAFQSFLYIDNFGSTVACDCHLLHAWSFLRRVHRDPGEFSKRNAISLAYWLRLPCEPTAGTGAGGGGGARLATRRTVDNLPAADLTCVRADGCPPGCTCVERATPSELVVDCRGAGLTAMPNRLPPSVHPVRYVLLLADNRIRGLGAMPNADRVQEIDLSRNLITEATDFAPLVGFPHLHSLNLTGNPIRRIPPSLLDLGRGGGLSPRVRLFGGGGVDNGVQCDCGFLEPDAWERLRRLLTRDDIRHLRCIDLPSTDSAVQGDLRQLLQPEDYRRKHCVRQFNTTSIVYRERQATVEPVLLYIGIGVVAFFLLALIVAVLTAVVLRYRGGAVGRHRKTADDPATVPPQPTLMQQTLTQSSELPLCDGSDGVFAFHCVSPDYLPPGYSPYDNPRYVPPRPAGGGPPATTFVLLRGADFDCDCDCDGESGGRRWPEFRGRIRSRSLSDSDDISTNSGGGGISDPSVSTRCPRHRVQRGGRGHGQRHGRASGEQRPSRLLLERQQLLPPPLPPRGHLPLNPHLAGSGLATLVTDV